METSRRVTAAYDVVAARYAERNAVVPPVYQALAPRFREMAAPDSAVLDLGCGAGRDLGWLLGQGVNAIGGDLSVGMLRVARQQAAGRLVRLDMRQLPFGDGAVGGVWCSASMLHLPKAEAPTALAEMYRVLPQGAPLLLAVQEGDGETWERGAYDADVERFFARYLPDEVEALLAGAGFRVLERPALYDEVRHRRWLTFLSTRA
jgi:SAM-dependent methyltransferase